MEYLHAGKPPHNVSGRAVLVTYDALPVRAGAGAQAGRPHQT